MRVKLSALSQRHMLPDCRDTGKWRGTVIAGRVPAHQIPFRLPVMEGKPVRVGKMTVNFI